MPYFRPSQIDNTLLPVLFESLFAESLWVVICHYPALDASEMPAFEYVESTVLNERREERTVVPVWTKPEYAEHYRHGWDRPYLEQLLCVYWVVGADLLARLAQLNANIVIDHGRQGLIVGAAVWRPAFERYGQTNGIALPDTPNKHWRPADPDDFPVWRDRLTSLLRNVSHIRMAWLLWVPPTSDSPRRLCLVVVALFDFGDERIRRALHLFSQDLPLPPLAYLPLQFGDPRLSQVPDDAPMFYCDQLYNALEVASGRRPGRPFGTR